MSFLTPLALLGLLLAIPIILLYMLRLRRRELLVSSNFLWRQVVQDTEANTPWQRLRRNLLLLLQLLILLLLVLALARPAAEVETISAGRTVVLLDASASMNASDGPEGRTRFAQAQDEARRLVRSMGAGDELSLIRVAEISAPLVSYTNDQQALLRGISGAQAGQGRGDWATALTLAAAGAQGAEQFNIVIISDGGLDDTLSLPENIPQPIYIPVGSSSANLALTALATRNVPGAPPQLFARVDNYSDQPVLASLVIALDGDIWDSTRSQTVSARSQRSYVFAIDAPFTTIEATIVYNNTVTDHLMLDNTAWTVADDDASRRVLVMSAGGNTFIDQVLRSLPGVEAFRGDASRETLPGGAYDVYVFDGWLPPQLPAADMLIINPPRSTDLFTLGTAVDAARRTEIQSAEHPLLTFLDFDAVNLRSYRPMTGADWAETLATNNENAVLLAGENAGRQVVVLPFDLRDSDLPLNIAWPILMANTLEWFRPANLIDEVSANLIVGDSVRLRPATDADSVRITLPDASTRTLPVNAETLTFSEANVPGLYTADVLQGGSVLQTQQFAMNLFGTGESDITPRTEAEVQLGGSVQDVAETEAQTSLQEFWPLVALLGLLILLIEWSVYHRRQRIPASPARRGLSRSTART